MTAITMLAGVEPILPAGQAGDVAGWMESRRRIGRRTSSKTDVGLKMKETE